MNSRLVSYLLLLAVVACSASVIMVMMQMDATRVRLKDSNPGAMNYLMQTYRNLDGLQERLSDLYMDSGSDNDAQNWQEAKTQFDIVWSMFEIVEVSGPGDPNPLPGQVGFIRESDQFLSGNDELFAGDKIPPKADVIQLLQDLRPLTEKTHTLGLQYFSSASEFRDDVNARLIKLNQYFWMSALTLLVTATLLIWQLFKVNAASRKMFSDARTSEEQLSQVVDELRSGRLEQKAKDSFLAAASHDLRQPLHALGLFVNALENKVMPPDGSVILEKVKQSTAALNSLFNSLLDISRLDAGVVEAVPEHFNIGDMLDNLNEEFAEMAAKRGLEFEVNNSDKVAFTDGVLLGRILRNLIDNAIVHSDSGKVVVACTSKGKYLDIQISDEGPGIPLAEQPYIFSEYYQLDNPERDRSKGLGLGLSIVKRLCELLEIKLTMNSDTGKGTTFSLLIPVGRYEELLKRSEIEKIAEDAFDFNGQLVLVIDDERDVREGMELILRQANCRVYSAESSQAACELIVERDLIPQLIIADYRLREGLTGLQAIDDIREELNDDVPAFVITGDTSPERVREVSESGMELMHKPVVPTRLFRVVSSVLSEVRLSKVETG